MKIRKLHTIAGLTLLLPFLCWIVTAMVFYIKPGYDEAYAFLQIKMYPINHPVAIVPDSGWTEVRFVRTILGDHILAHTADGWKNIDPASGKPYSAPTGERLQSLVYDAFRSDSARYGRIASVSNDTIHTNTGVEVILNWNRLSLQQRGKDTDRIDLLYKIHYLQWTGIPAIDKILGPVGLLLVFSLSLLGLILAFSKRL